MVRSKCALLAVALLASSGCATSFSRHSRTNASADGESQTKNATTTKVTAADDGAKEPAAAVAPADANRVALAGVLAELEAAGTLDPAAKERLIADLKQTDPALWPQLMQYFRASLAYKEAQHAEADEHQAQRTAADNAPTGLSTAPKDERSAAVVTKRAEPVVAVSHSQPSAKPTEKATSDQGETTAAAPTDPAAKPPETEAALATATAVATAVAPSTPPAAPDAEERPWREHLAAAIAGLEKETDQPPDSIGAIGQHARLRMLYLAAGQRDEALKPIVGLPALQHDFWSKEMYGLATYLDVQRNPQETRRAAEAASALRDATARLGEMATLSVRNVAFCTEVNSYGVYKKFDHDEFHAGQEVLLYTEVENFKSQPSDKGFHTSLRSSYQILDERGARVDQKEFEVIEEHCQNARRDYFLRYFVWMPKRIYGGRYTLQLTIEDTLSQKIGQASIEFKIHEKDN